MLKTYQIESLEALSNFLHKCAIYKDVKRAYSESTLKEFKHEGIYNDAGFTNIPYVCLRLPTGGGKTFLAAHSIPIACKELLARDFSLVVWLVPSNAILEQTYSCLQDNSHPYRQALNQYFNGSVEILKIENARSISKGQLQSNTVIIISTFASWRVDKTEGRKVYEENGSLTSHFENLKSKQKEYLEKFKDSNTVIPSLANVVYLNNPIFVIDEAHNARTKLTFEVLKRLNPSCLIEFTATPKTNGNDRSNVLYSVSAAELKAEDMIKMPIELEVTSEWQKTVSDAVKKQRELESIAKEEAKITEEYIRPIVLIQAQHDSQHESTINVNEVKTFLLNTLNIPEDQIAVATGTERGIENKNLLLSTEPIRFIITKQALKEGWDCPFAYVFCSVAKVNSSKDVEQLLGRVLRMPNVKRKQNDELNRSYAFVSSNNFFTTAKNLQDSLVESGFTSVEASELIEINPKQLDFGTYFGNLSIQLSSSIDETKLSQQIQNKIVFDSKENTLIIKNPLTETEQLEFINNVKTVKDKETVLNTFESINRFTQKTQSPSKKGIKFSIPQLLFDYDGEWIPFNEEVLIQSDWNLANCDSTFNDAELPIKVDAGTKGLIDIDYRGDTFIHKPEQIQEELSSLILSSVIDKTGLIRWLVDESRNQSITYSQTIVFVTNCVENLISSRGLTIEQLAFIKFRLRDAVRNKIKSHLISAKKYGYQTLLFAQPSVVKESLSKFSVGQDFEFPQSYFPINDYSGKIRYSKHFYDRIGDMNDEEAECAFNIDMNSNVEFWIRNIERQEWNSFWLQTSTDKFYPDFIVKLKNGTIVIIEYKGADRFSNDDSKEKRQIGDFYAGISQGKCRFVMLKGKDWNTLSKYLNK